MGARSVVGTRGLWFAARGEKKGTEIHNCHPKTVDEHADHNEELW